MMGWVTVEFEVDASIEILEVLVLKNLFCHVLRIHVLGCSFHATSTSTMWVCLTTVV